MFRDYNEIVFKAGDILSAQMLEETYRYPREFLHLSHITYSDGIISGLDFVSRDDGVYLTAGIVKQKGKYHILPKDVNLDKWLCEQNPKLISGIEYFLCMVNEEVDVRKKESNSDFTSCTKLSLKVFPKNKPNDSSLLGKFRFDFNRLYLPEVKIDDKEPFENFFKSGNLKLFDVNYSHVGGKPTYHPLLFRAIQSYLENKKSLLSPYDFSLLLEIQNRGIVAMTSLKKYLATNGEVDLLSNEMTKEKLFQEVVQCIQKPYQPSTFSEMPAVQSTTNRFKRRSQLIE